MSPADIPADRKHLAAMLKVFARSGAYFGIPARTELIQYIEICEDTIEQQCQVMRDDAEDITRVHSENSLKVGQIRRLKAEIASLHELIEAAITAGQQDDGEAISIIRAALEGTS